MIIFVWALVSSWLFAQLPAPGQAAVGVYQNAITAAEAGRVAGRVEAAFSALMSMRRALTRTRDNQGTVLESISDDEFERLRRELRGVIINRQEVVIVHPDPQYFANLAAAHGNAVDRAFFSALKTTYSETVWPIYLEQQTDYSGCTRFGSGKLIEVYVAWADFQRSFPTRYVEGSREQLDSVGSQLAESTCACGDAASVQNELQNFLARVKTSPIRAKVSERLRGLQSRRSDIRVNCISG